MRKPDRLAASRGNKGMRKQVIEGAALDVAHQVRAVEDCIDEALGQIATLQARMIAVRAVAGIGVATGHQALVEVAGALNGLVAARGGMAAAHAVLRETTQFVPGLRTTSFGEPNECPPAHARTELRVVA